MRFISGPNRGRLGGEIRGRRRASSLIELLVVISIIAILFGLLIPSLQRSIRQVRHTMCQNNLMRVNTGLHIYRVEHGGWLPVSAEVDESVVAQEEAPPVAVRVQSSLATSFQSDITLQGRTAASRMVDLRAEGIPHNDFWSDVKFATLPIERDSRDSR